MSHITDKEIIDAFVSDEASFTGIALSTLPEGFGQEDITRAEIRYEKILRNHIQSLESQLAESRAENSAEVERLRAFRAAVLGWRIHNHPEWFCRRTAETVADYGRAGEEQTIQ